MYVVKKRVSFSKVTFDDGDARELSPTISELSLAPLGPGQFLVRVTVNGVKLCILYDSGASLCFARTGLSMLTDSLCASPGQKQNRGGLRIRLGDDSLASYNS